MEKNRQFLRKNDYKAIAFCGLLTVGLLSAVLFIPALWSVSVVSRLCAVLMVSTVWICLLGPISSAGATGGWASVARAGVYCDATAVFLFICSFWIEQLSILAVLKIYAIHLSMILLGWSCVFLARTRAGRYCSALAVSVTMFAFMASPFWMSGILQFMSESAANEAATFLMRINPIYAVLSTVVEKTEFVWHYAPVMYRITSIGQDIPAGSISWYHSVFVMLLLSILASGVRLVIQSGKQAD